MKVRDFEDRDAETLKAIGAANGYEYPDLKSPLIEAVHIVEDDDGNILAAAASERIVQLYLWCQEGHNPLSKVLALRMLHDSMATKLKELNYSEANIFIPPALEKPFGRRLQRSFNWRWNWRSMFLKF